jgi:hypothetical protein
MRNFIKRNQYALASILSGAGLASAAISLAACTSPAVDLGDVVCNAVDSVQSAYTAALVDNLGTIVTAVIAITVTFVLIKLAMRWIRKGVH